MRAISTTAKKKIFGLVAGVGVVSLVFAGSNGLAAIADPSDVSEAQGKFLAASIGGVNAAALAALDFALAENDSGTHPTDAAGLSAVLLNSIGVNLGTINLLGGNGLIQLGAVEQYATANDNGDAFAGSGAVTNSGAIAIDDAPDPGIANASVDLGPLLAGADLNNIVDTLGLEIGALASTASQVGGAPATSDYLIDGLTFDLESDLVSNIATTLNTTVGQLQTTLDGLEAALELGVNGVNLGALATIGADLTIVAPNLSDALPTGPLGSGGVLVDLTAGTISVDLAQFVDLNNLAPNTEILTPAVIGAISNAVTATITSIVQGVVNGVTTAINTLAIDGTVTVTVLGNGLTVDIGGTLLAPTAVIVPSGLVATILLALGLDANGLVTPILTAIGTITSGLFTQLAAFQTTVTTLVGTIQSAIVNPLLGVLDGIVNLTANVQPTAPPTSLPGGDLGPGSFTVRALSITLLDLLPTVPAVARVDLASSTVRGTLAAVDTDTDVVDGNDVVDGPDTEADADTDADVDVDVADADADGNDGVLASTGSTFDGLWLAGLGVLALLAGAALYLTRRRSMES